MTNNPNMTEAVASEVFDILVEHAGASERHRRAFVHAQVHDEYPCLEYRFQGALGFGGKFWRNPSFNHQGWYVNCYREDETKEWRKIIERTNAALAEVERRILAA